MCVFEHICVELLGILWYEICIVIHILLCAFLPHELEGICWSSPINDIFKLHCHWTQSILIRVKQNMKECGHLTSSNVDLSVYTCNWGRVHYVIFKGGDNSSVHKKYSRFFSPFFYAITNQCHFIYLHYDYLPRCWRQTNGTLTKPLILNIFYRCMRSLSSLPWTTSIRR